MMIQMKLIQFLRISIFYSAFVIRKIVDCKTKLSDEADCYALKVEIFESKKHFDNMHHWTSEDSDKCLYHVTLKDWLNYIDFIRSDDVFEFSAERTEKGIRYKKVRNKSLY